MILVNDDEAKWSKFAGLLFTNAVFHPVDYAKILIQIGHEPIPPRETVTLFGKPALALPNVFTYIKYIKRMDGVQGCYRGLVPKLCAHTLHLVGMEKTADKFKMPPELCVDEDELSEEDRRRKYLHQLVKDLVSQMVGIVISHPLQIVAIRMMAQFVGGETKYSGIFGSLVEIYKENGISGYFSGLIPSLIASAASTVLVVSSTYALNKYVIKEKPMRVYTSATVSFLASTLTYPFLVVSHCMVVNNCGLIAGIPPQMPVYNSWLDCWSHLSRVNQLKRGSSLLWRYYTGPQVLIGGKLFAVSK